MARLAVQVVRAARQGGGGRLVRCGVGGAGFWVGRLRLFVMFSHDVFVVVVVVFEQSGDC